MPTSVTRRALVVLLVTSAVLMAGGRLMAAGPGDVPANGVTVGVTSSESCVSQTLDPAASIWFKIAYTRNTDLKLCTIGFGGVSLKVYDPAQISAWPNLPAPVGLLSYDRNEPQYMSNWQGHAWNGNQSDFYYVLATNMNSYPATFSFCTQEREQFFPPASLYVPPPLR